METHLYVDCTIDGAVDSAVDAVDCAVDCDFAGGSFVGVIAEIST